MKLQQHWRVISCLALLAAASMLLGAVLGWRTARVRFQARSNPENWNVAAMRTFERTVKPTDEQRERIRKYLDQAVEDLKGIRSETISRSTNVIWRLVSEVEKELTPEQKAAFESMKPSQGEISNMDVLNVEHPK